MEPHPSDPSKTYAQFIADQWVERSLTSPHYLEELLARMEGKVTQPIGGEGGKPIKVSIDYKGKIISAISRHAARGGESEDDPKS